MKKTPVFELRRPYYDGTLHFKGWQGCPSWCGIRIWADGPVGAAAPTRYVVVMTELTDNEGVSVTNAAEIIATVAFRTLLSRIDPEIITWIEHWPPRGGRDPFPESFDFVFLKYDGSQFRLDASATHPWKRMGEDDLRNLGLLR